MNERTNYLLNIGVITRKGNPKVEETDCSCGERLIYQAGPLNSSVNGNVVRVESIYAYQHEDKSKCGVTLTLPEVTAVVDAYIDEMRSVMQNTDRSFFKIP